MKMNNVARRFDPPAFFFDVPLIAQEKGDQGNVPAKMLFATELEGIEFETDNSIQPAILEITSKERFEGGRTPLHRLE